MNNNRPTNQLQVVILYENTEAAKRAKEFYDRLENQLTPACALSLCLWSLASLKLPTMAKTVATAAERAELIIVAVNGGKLLPAKVRDCIAACGGETRIGHGALLAQLHGIHKTDESISPAYREMRSIACQCGRRFYSQVVELEIYEPTPAWTDSTSCNPRGLYAEVHP